MNPLFLADTSPILADEITIFQTLLPLAAPRKHGGSLLKRRGQHGSPDLSHGSHGFSHGNLRMIMFHYMFSISCITPTLGIWKDK
jgi:hypothetical protein